MGKLCLHHIFFHLLAHFIDSRFRLKSAVWIVKRSYVFTIVFIIENLQEFHISIFQQQRSEFKALVNRYIFAAKVWYRVFLQICTETALFRG